MPLLWRKPAMVGDYLLLHKVRQKLIENTMEPVAVFLYFLVVTIFDGFQLILLQVQPVSVSQYTALSAWGSGFIGLSFIVMCFLINGGNKGARYLEKYFSLCAVIGMWVIVPFQLLLAAPNYFSSLASISWYTPAVILSVNVLIFSFLAIQFIKINSDRKQ